MTQLGEPHAEVVAIRAHILDILSTFDIKLIDADSKVTGKDFLLKIWSLLLAVPLGVAVIHEKMRTETLCNIFYELGVLQAYGKETLVVKTEGAPFPSDFVRTEYVKYDGAFERRMRSFLENFLKQAEYFEDAADLVEKNPLLSVDYLRRAYLISGKKDLRKKVRTLMAAAALDGRAKNSVEMLFADF